MFIFKFKLVHPEDVHTFMKINFLLPNSYFGSKMCELNLIFSLNLIYQQYARKSLQIFQFKPYFGSGAVTPGQCKK